MSALQFLNKKSWHTATLRNNEKVWAAEKKAVEEKKRLAELQKQLAEEREQEELRRLEAESGRLTGDALKRTQRLDWMYEGAGTGAGRQMTAHDPEVESGPGASKANEKDREDYLLGKKELNMNAAGEARQKPDAVHAPKFSDTEAKLRDDPLMAIKLAERAAVDAIRTNPVKMAAIQKQAGEKERRRTERKMKRWERQQRREEREKKQHMSRSHTNDRHRQSHDKHPDHDRERIHKHDTQERKAPREGANYGLDETNARAPASQFVARPVAPIASRELARRPPLPRDNHRRHLSDDERARRLLEMQRDAGVNDRERTSRVERHRSRVEREDQRPHSHKSEQFVASISRTALDNKLR